MEMILQRIYNGEDCTIGVLTSAHRMLGYTLELPWENNERNISCIPSGKYDIAFKNSNGYVKNIQINLLNVPGRDGITIHSGNTTDDIRGCILIGGELGKLLGKRAVLRSKERIKVLQSFLFVKNITLTIKDMP